MVALATVLVAVLVSLLIARIATVVLVLTGRSHQAARFQARGKRRTPGGLGVPNAAQIGSLSSLGSAAAS
jgi:hypothetical protein